MDERIETLEGELDAHGLRFAVVASRFNDFIVDRMLEAAVDALTKHGAAPGDITVVRVPGAFEIPLALDAAAASNRFDGLVALGCVIRGETPHFDYVAAEASRGITDVSLAHEIPVGFGVLTVDNIEQAEARAGGKGGNKGTDAALAAIQMVTLLQRLGE